MGCGSSVPLGPAPYMVEHTDLASTDAGDCKQDVGMSIELGVVAIALVNVASYRVV